MKRYFIPAVIGFAPLMLFLLNWDAELMTRNARILRELTLPVLGAELFTVAIAVREGMVRSWKDLRLPRPALIALSALVLIAVGTAAFVSPSPYAAASRTFCLITHLLFGFSIAYLCARLFDAVDLMTAYLAGFAALAVAFLIFAIGAIDRPMNWISELPSFSHIRHLGIYATPMIALSLGLVATMRGRAVWALSIILITCGFALVLWTGSRGPVFSIGAAMVAGAIVSPAMRRPAVWGAAAASIAIAYFAVRFLPVPDPTMMGVLRTISATQGNDIATGRMELWRIVIEAIERRPLFGYGEGQMKTVAAFYGMAQPHNLVLQILLAWGIVGLLCSLVLMFYFARMALPAVRRNEIWALPPMLAMLALGALSMLDAALYHILPLSIFAACAGMIAAGRQAESTTSLHRSA